MNALGMYTQVRGWLNVDSIAFGTERFDILSRQLEQAKNDFMGRDLCVRKWVSDYTWIHLSSNGAVFLFVGAEIKNYDSDAETWIKHLVKYFPNAEGRIDFQYEEEEAEADESKYWEIYKGRIKERHCATWCKGYGNMFEVEKEIS